MEVKKLIKKNIINQNNIKQNDIKQNDITQNNIAQNDITQNDIKQNNIKQNDIKYNKLHNVIILFYYIMKFELIIFGIAGFLIYNTYYDNKYSKLILSYKKYYQIIIIIIVTFSIYMLVKRDPIKSRQMLLYANNAIKYMPIDKSSMSIISPIFDFTTSNKGFMEEINRNINNQYNPTIQYNSKETNSFNKPTKRSVSETKKKYIAYMQDWKCFKCQNKLTHTFEVDHKIRLEQGGGNDVSNLVAMCRECHGQKTAMENM